MTQTLVEPIAVIIASAEALRDRAEQAGGDGLLSDLGKILTAANNFSALVSQLAASADRTAAPAMLTRDARHDLLNPVSQIIGYAEMLIEEDQDHPVEWSLGDLQRIVEAAKDLTGRIDAAAGRTDERRSQPRNRVTGHDTDPAGESASHLPAPVAAPRPLPTAAHPLLVVDDDALNRDILTKRLERNGFKVLTAGDGVQALEILEREPIDLVLLDVLMPKMDGFQVLERMKATGTLSDVPVLMISGLSEIESVVRCIEMGAADYLPKPFNPVLLQARIGACLEKKQLRDQERRTYQALKASQEALAAELAEAADYVRSLLPPTIQSDDVTVDWRFIPSTQLGGDAFGYRWLDRDHFALYLFDVCGHGVGAALLSASVINVLGRLHGIDMLAPGAVLQALNDAFQMDRHNGQYFTIWYGVYDRRRQTLVHASGGHPPAVLLTSAGGSPMVTPLAHPGLIIGGFPDVTYGQTESEVPAGSRLYVFSDGLYEIPTIDGTMLDYDGFVRMFTAPAASTGPALDGLIEKLRVLRGAETFDDDVSIMEVNFASKTTAATTRT